MDAGDTPEALWRWQPPMTDDLRRKVRTSSIVLALVTIGAMAAAALSPARMVIVLSILLASIGVLWWIQHRRFRSTCLSIAPDGRLTVGDNRETTTIDLARIDTIAVRRRAMNSRSLLQASTCWAIELAGPDASFSHEIALAGGLFSLAEPEMRQLEQALREQALQHGARLSPGATQADASPQPTLASEQPAATEAETARAGEPFVWRPPVSPGAARRRGIFRIGYIGFALLIAVVGGVSVRDEGIGAILLTALTVPGLILLLCGWLDYAAVRARRFRLTVCDGVLRIDGRGAPAQIDLRGASVAIERRGHMVATGNGSVRSASWWLEVEAADGEKLARMFPSWGTDTRQDDYVALERELRRRA